MAHFAQDEGLCATLRDPHQDPFRRLAAQWLHAPEDQVGALLLRGLFWGEARWGGRVFRHSEFTLLEAQVVALVSTRALLCHQSTASRQSPVQKVKLGSPNLAIFLVKAVRVRALLRRRRTGGCLPCKPQLYAGHRLNNVMNNNNNNNNSKNAFQLMMS